MSKNYMTKLSEMIEDLDNICKTEDTGTLVEDDQHIYTDCRDTVGITIGLIDGLIAIARVLRQSNLESHEVKQALLDLQGDEDIQFLLDIR